MAYPTGSGSEILRRSAIHNQVDDATSFRFDGTGPTTGTETYAVPANHIITILNVTFSSQDTNINNFTFWVNLSGTEIKLLQNQTLPAFRTYAWKDKIVLHPTDKLIVNSIAGANMDVFYSYIDQNWE